jgi:hypothetical protein
MLERAISGENAGTDRGGLEGAAEGFGSPDQRQHGDPQGGRDAAAGGAGIARRIIERLRSTPPLPGVSP